ncbi:SusC/RagA family TonB-linked outer membrane protein [Foetidibacter luteolus]|uniref:SusC/RagA family TonB-linked outer membrane protein n=1 Tax=Foetidibacter luteolus TaxID=2608880 RepID=UPI00129B3696|nr:TonB-dependent receptor [Foetidibacter luteolus]
MRHPKTKRKLWYIVCAIVSYWALALPSYVQAQQSGPRKISGVIVSKKSGQPISGANLTVRGTKNVATTDNEGKFTIMAETGQVIEATFVGFANTRITVGNSSTANFSMEEDYSTLNDVVVVGYGKMKKTDQTSAQVSVSAADINKTVNTTIDQALQGRAAGVYVTQNSGQPGGGISVNIRGVNSLSGTTEPLYVIDGVQIQPNTVSYGNSSSINPLAGINPSDIESMEILQGPSATAIYGSRATNGVILVTTKRGKAGQVKVTYNYMYSLQDKPEALPTLNLQQFAIMNNEIATLLNRTPNADFKNPSVLGEGTNWQDAMFKTAPLQKHQVTMSGGMGNTTYYMSGEYFDQEGVAIGSKFGRYSFRLNLDNQAFKWLKLNTSLNYYQTKEKLASTSEDVIRNALTLAPNIAVKNPDGTWGGATENEYGGNAKYAPVNPIAIANLVNNDFKKTGGLGSLGAEITLMKGLVFRASFNGNFENGEGTKFTPTYRLGYISNEKASLSFSTSKNYYWNLNQLVQYNTNIGRHSIGAMASHEAQSGSYQGYSGTRIGFVSNEIPSFNLGDAQGQTTGSYKGSWAMESYLSRINYSFDNKYIVQLAGRADASSNFGQANRWGYFPSVSAAWRVTEEGFMKGIGFINDLKIRAEWGKTGNNGGGGQFSPLGPVTTPLGTGFRTTQYGNPNIQWEATTTKNIGFNLSMLKNRVQLEGDYYIKHTNNLLMPLGLPAYMGTSGEGAVGAPNVNIGTLENKGFAITLNTVNIDNKAGFSWRTNFNISSFKTKITKLNSDAAFLRKSAWYMNNFEERSVVGQAPWLMYGYISEGVFQSVEEINNSAIPTQSDGSRLPVQQDGGVWVGDRKYKDLNGDNVIDSRDQTFIGNPWPKITFGFTNTFSFKGFDLSILLTGAQGNDIYNYLRYQNADPNNINLGRNLFSESFNYARVTTDGDGKVSLANPGTNVTRIVGSDVNGNSNRFTDIYVEDGSYIRIKNIQLGYNLPGQWLKKQAVVKGIRLTAGVQNLATFTKYKGYDPEVGAYIGKEVQLSSQFIGVDAGRYPLTRLYTFSIGVDF